MNLLPAFRPLTADAILTKLCTIQVGRTLHLLAQTDSTNTAALALAQAGAPDGTVVIADTQTAGRGRLGRTWHSPPGQNLYCSVVFRTTPPAELLSLWLSWVPLFSALAVARAVHAPTGLTPGVKWPNDVLLNDRKLGGILCESSGTGRADGVVIVGIGLNVNARRDSFPEDLRGIATSLALEAGRPFDRAALAAALFAELEVRRDAFLRGDLDDIRREYALRCGTLGKRVRIERADRGTIEGIAEAVAPDGALCVRLENERSGMPEVIAIRAGDVTHMRAVRP